MEYKDIIVFGEVIKLFPVQTIKTSGEKRQSVLIRVGENENHRLVFTCYKKDINSLMEGDFIEVHVGSDAKPTRNDPNVWLQYFNARWINVLRKSVAHH